MKRYFPPSELLIEPNGAVYHLGVKPSQLADKVILVGDPNRVPKVAAYFDSQECDVAAREFRTITGTYKGKRISVVGTGIGCDNIDIVVNELDALANIDFETRYEKSEFRQLQMVRIGTCGGLQENTPTGSYICSVKSIGFDGLLNFYAGRNEVCDLEFEEAFKKHLNWSPLLSAPYTIASDPELVERIAQDDMVRGVTISCGGFFGPQGRQLRVPLAFPQQNELVVSFEHRGWRVTNFEMESSALAGLARLMGHKATTVCLVIAHRIAKQATVDYDAKMKELIHTVLERI